MELSNREKEIMTLISNGFTSREIGDKLFISKQTVDSHRKNISNKLKPFGIKNLIIYASKNY
jgi:two-component system nitrate/nitrite response regulator NarL